MEEQGQSEKVLPLSLHASRVKNRRHPRRWRPCPPLLGGAVIAECFLLAPARRVTRAWCCLSSAGRGYDAAVVVRFPKLRMLSWRYVLYCLLRLEGGIESGARKAAMMDGTLVHELFIGVSDWGTHVEAMTGRRTSKHLPDALRAGVLYGVPPHPFAVASSPTSIWGRWHCSNDRSSGCQQLPLHIVRVQAKRTTSLFFYLGIIFIMLLIQQCAA